jgi:GLPGLI family protein
MKIFLLYSILFSGFVKSQGNLRLVYEYSYSPDSLNHEYTRTEVYHLDIGDRKSLFYNKNRVSADTLSQQKFLFSDFDYMLEKDNIAGSLVQYNQLSNFTYQITDKPEYDWEVINERSKWMNYSVQRAECSFRGRKWNAWFSSDLPFPSGPYKFHGLPGLIVKISDESNSHSFVLIELQNQPDPVKIKPSQPLILSRQSFNKIVKAYRNNPQKELQHIEILQTEDGLSSADFKKRMQEYYRRKMMQENNYIELK